MKKKYLYGLGILLISSLFVACGRKTEDIETNLVDTSVPFLETEEKQVESDMFVTETTESEKENVTETAETGTLEMGDKVSIEKMTDVTFEDLSKKEFCFCSGAGGWSTDFYIEKDGYLHGEYHDSDMGDCGDEYPNGTIYYCTFTGHLSNLHQVDEFTYEMDVLDITSTDKNGDYIEDGVNWVHSFPYGLEEAKTLQVYLPGKPLNNISEELLSWLHLWGEDNVVDSLCLADEEHGYGMTSAERMSPREDAEATYQTYLESYEYYGSKISESDQTAVWVSLLEKKYEIADDCLNYLWRLIKYNTEEAEFQKILEEQRNWLKQRDEQVASVMKEHDGGTMETVDYWDVNSSLTMERCEELLSYIK